jgi:hypothetical protein
MTTTEAKINVVLVHRRESEPDRELAGVIEGQLRSTPCQVFTDAAGTVGMGWARELEQRIRAADALIPLLSPASIHSELLSYEVETAREAAQLQHGRPSLLPVRVNYTGPLPEPLAGILDPVPYLLWEGPHDNLGLVTELAEALKHLPPRTLTAAPHSPRRPAHLAAKPAPVSHRPPALEGIGGAVPLDSEYYVTRPVDAELRHAITQRESTVLIKGARQMGKTSLLARGLEHARQQGWRAVSTDLQKFNAESFRSVDRLYRAMADTITEQLDLAASPTAHWDSRRGPNANLERFLRREVLSRDAAPLVWGLDEVDRLFVTPFGTEFFGLLRSWHNERALEPDGPWAQLTIAIAYATEAHLFIADLNQSPFNIGTRLALEDFTPLQVAELNRRYGNPLRSQDQLTRFYRLVGGHPYLVRRGLQELTTSKAGFDSFEEHAARDEACYGDHLHRLLVLLFRDPQLPEAMRAILHDQSCHDLPSFERLRSAGLVAGHSPTEARPRCRLYASFLRRHLA